MKTWEKPTRKKLGRRDLYIGGASADPRLLGALRKDVSWGVGGVGRMDETHLPVFHSVSNRARGKRSRNSISSAARVSSSFFFF